MVLLISSIDPIFALSNPTYLYKSILSTVDYHARYLYWLTDKSFLNSGGSLPSEKRGVVVMLRVGIVWNCVPFRPFSKTRQRIHGVVVHQEPFL